MMPGILLAQTAAATGFSTAMFYIFSVVIIVFSLLTVLSGRILRAAVYLLFVLVSTAGLYFMLGYFFLAAVQITVYVGGIVVLIIFSILLTHNINHRFSKPNILRLSGGGILALGGIALAVLSIRSFVFPAPASSVADASIKGIGRALLETGANGYALPFEFISVLLLAAMVGAIIIAKKN